MISLLGLRTFNAVVETGGIRAAAERLGRTPSAVSMMLKQLEDQIGGSLFQSDRKHTLSELGLRVHHEEKALLAHYERASAAMIAFAANRVGRCDVASVPSVAVTFLPDAISMVRDKSGHFEIQVSDMDSHAVIDAVENGAVEIGFCVLNRHRTGIAFEAMFRESLDLVCRADHALARRGSSVTWDEIDARSFIANGSTASIRSLEALALVEKATLQARNVTSILAMVRAGLGVTVLPRLCRHQSSSDIRFLPLADDGAQRIVGCASKEERALLPATAQLLAEVRKLVQGRAGQLDYRPLGPT